MPHPDLCKRHYGISASSILFPIGSLFHRPSVCRCGLPYCIARAQTRETGSHIIYLVTRRSLRSLPGFVWLMSNIKLIIQFKLRSKLMDQPEHLVQMLLSSLFSFFLVDSSPVPPCQSPKFQTSTFTLLVRQPDVFSRPGRHLPLTPPVYLFCDIYRQPDVNSLSITSPLVYLR